MGGLTMEIEELMINDWVQVPSEMNRYKRVCSTFDMDSAVLYRPIPLTEEILKANGYEEHVGEKGAYGVTIAPYFKRDDSPEVFCDGHPFAVWFDEPVDIKYVHQLQHVLRLYGAEKEIKIKED